MHRNCNASEPGWSVLWHVGLRCSARACAWLIGACVPSRNDGDRARSFYRWGRRGVRTAGSLPPRSSAEMEPIRADEWKDRPDRLSHSLPFRV